MAVMAVQDAENVPLLCRLIPHASQAQGAATPWTSKTLKRVVNIGKLEVGRKGQGGLAFPEDARG